MIGFDWDDGTLYIYRQGRWCLALTPPRLYLSRDHRHRNQRTDLLPHAIDANGWCHNHTNCSTYLDGLYDRQDHPEHTVDFISAAWVSNGDDPGQWTSIRSDNTGVIRT